MAYAMTILAVTVAAFFLQLAVPGFTEFLILDPVHLFQQPWTLVTSMFLHGNFTHLFFNMFALIIFGPLLEGKIGGRHYITLYFIAGLAGGIGYIVTGGSSPALGASGAIFGILGALAFIEPNMIVFVGMIPMPMWLAGIFWFITETVSGVYELSNIANFAHVFGLVIGYFYARQVRPHLVLYS